MIVLNRTITKPEAKQNKKSKWLYSHSLQREIIQSLAPTKRKMKVRLFVAFNSASYSKM